jgi:transketolase
VESRGRDGVLIVAELLYVPARELDRARHTSSDGVRATELFATLCRINTLYMIARAGSGHIGSSFSSLDIVAWLHLHELGPGDRFFSSKGHDVPGLYAVLIALGRLPFENLHQLRRLGGLPGHPDVGTPEMVTNTGPLGMGISKAKGLVRANRLTGRQGRIFVMTGDGELQEGQLWESLAGAVHEGMGEITAIVDHNKVQSDTLVSSVSDLGDLEQKFAVFGWEVARCDGHDLAALRATLDRARKLSDRPKVIIADTIKGRGVSFMEHTALLTQEKYYRFHSGAPEDATYAKAAAELIATANRQLEELSQAPLQLEQAPGPQRPDLQGTQRLVPAYSRALLAHAQRDTRIVALDADLVLDTGLIPFSERLRERFIECGIAEQDMVSQAGALALGGLLPVVHSFACFLTTRANEQIYNNATERRKIVYVGSLAGLLPGGPGHSHQSVRDIAALGGVPGLIMLQPSCEAELEQAVGFCLAEAEESCYLRLTSIPCQVPFRLPSGYLLERGRGVTLTEGGDAVLFGYGPVLLSQAYRAVALLRERHDLAVRLINLPWLNQVDADWLAGEVAGVPAVFTLDDHYVDGGQGQMLTARLAELGLAPMPRVERFGVRSIPACGQNDEVLRAHRLDAESLAVDLAAALHGGPPD